MIIWLDKSKKEHFCKLGDQYYLIDTHSPVTAFAPSNIHPATAHKRPLFVHSTSRGYRSFTDLH